MKTLVGKTGIMKYTQRPGNDQRLSNPNSHEGVMVVKWIGFATPGGAEASNRGARVHRKGRKKRNCGASGRVHLQMG